MTVSQTLPSAVASVPDSALGLELIMWSAFRVNRRILPDGDCIANLAGFSRPDADRPDEIADVDAENSLETVDTEDPPAELETMLSALAGRENTDGEIRPLTPASLLIDEDDGEEGCCRTANTKVLLTASLAHWGCMIYKS